MQGNQVRLIESRQNPQFKTWLRLKESAGVKKSGQFLLSGRKLVPECLKQHSYAFQAIIREAGQKLDHPDLDCYELPRNLFSELDALGTKAPLLLGSFPKSEIWTPDKKGPFVGLPLQDPGNLGAALRSCSAFGISNVILLEEACHPYHMKCLKAASGAHFSVKLWQGPSVKSLPASDKSIGMDMEGTPLHQFHWPKDFCLFLGEEGPGLPNSFKSKICIPMSENMESLNATNSLSVALYDHWMKNR